MKEILSFFSFVYSELESATPEQKRDILEDTKALAALTFKGHKAEGYINFVLSTIEDTIPA
jgi:hypothetical protein